MSRPGKNLAFRGVPFRPRFAHFGIPLWGLIALTAGVICFGGFAVHGFDENGLRLGNQLAWRFACLVFFIAIIAGPVTRLLPWEKFRRADSEGPQLIWGFCASFGVFLASLIIPNTLTPPPLDHQGLSFSMALFAIFGAALTMMVAYVASPQRGLGERSRRVILGAGLSYYWLAYTLTGFSRLSGPHRPDAFYGWSVMLMLVALLLRFADNFIAKKTIRDDRSPQ